MWPLRPTGRALAGGRSLAVGLVVFLLVGVGPAGAAMVVAGGDDVADSDRPGKGAAGNQASVGSGLASVVDLLDQFDLEDDDEEEDEHDEEEDDGDADDEDEDDDEGEVEEGDDDQGEDDDDEAEDADEVDDDEEDEDDVDGFVGSVLTAVAGGPDDDRPGDGGEGPPDERPDRDEDDAVEPDWNPDKAGDDEASGPPGPAGDGADGPSSSQVEEPGPTESPEPARLRVEDVTTNRSAVAAGEPVRITAKIVNAGDVAGSRDVRLHLFGEVVDARTVTVPGDGTREVSFVRTIEAPGTYEASVGDASATVTVEGEETADVRVDPRSARQATPGFTALSAVLGVLAVALFARLWG